MAIEVPKSNSPFVQQTRTDLANLINFLNSLSFKSFKEKLTGERSLSNNRLFFSSILKSFLILNRFFFLTKKASRLAYMGFLGILFIFVVVLPLFFIILGLVNLQRCSAQSMLPIWLAVLGGIVLLSLIINFFILGCIVMKFPKLQPIQRVIDLIVVFFLFIWLICGTIWTFTIIYVRSDYTKCDYLLYNVCFWTVIALWAIFVLVITLYVIFRISKCVMQKISSKK